MKKLVAATGWKMNIGSAEALRYAGILKSLVAKLDVSAIDIFVLPPFTSLQAAADIRKDAGSH